MALVTPHAQLDETPESVSASRKCQTTYQGLKTPTPLNDHGQSECFADLERTSTSRH